MFQRSSWLTRWFDCNSSCHEDEKYGQYWTCRYLRYMYFWTFLLLSVPSAVQAIGRGEAESSSAWTYSGWACDSSAPGYQSVVQARRDDGVLLGRVVADRRSKVTVPGICDSSHEFHGFKLDITRKPDWVDGKPHEVTLFSVGANGVPTPFYTSSAIFSSSVDGVEPPRDMGDIVGRDLDYAKLGSIGHLGIWDGSKVLEILNEEKSSNKVFRNSWEDFKSRTSAWNTAHPKYPGHKVKSCWNSVCDVNPGRPGEIVISAQQAVVYRASQVYMIGSDYSYTVAFTTAEPAMIDFKEPSWKRGVIKGTYRSDTFIYDAFRASTDITLSGIFPYRQVYGMQNSWRDKVHSLYGMALVLPYKMMEKIREF